MMRARRHGMATLAGILVTASLWSGPAVGAPSLGPAGQTGVPAAVVQAALREGQFTFYGPSDQSDYDTIFGEFMRDYPGIKVRAIHVPSGVLTERVLSEIQARNVQVDVVHARSELIALHQANALVPYKVGAERRRSLFPSHLQVPGLVDSVLTRHVIYNTSLVAQSELPKTWEDLLNPKWRGKIAIQDTAYEWIGALRKEWGVERTTQFMTRLAPNVVVRRGNSQIVELTAAGEFAFFLNAYGDITWSFIQKGAPIAFLRTLEPVRVVATMWAAVKDSPHPNAAKLALHWVLSDRGQRAMLKVGRAPVARAVPNSVLPVQQWIGSARTFVVLPGDLDYAAIAAEYNRIFLRR